MRGWALEVKTEHLRRKTLVKGHGPVSWAKLLNTVLWLNEAGLGLFPPVDMPLTMGEGLAL